MKVSMNIMKYNIFSSMLYAYKNKILHFILFKHYLQLRYHNDNFGLNKIMKKLKIRLFLTNEFYTSFTK